MVLAMLVAFVVGYGVVAWLLWSRQNDLAELDAQRRVREWCGANGYACERRPSPAMYRDYDVVVGRSGVEGGVCGRGVKFKSWREAARHL